MQIFFFGNTFVVEKNLSAVNGKKDITTYFQKIQSLRFFQIVVETTIINDNQKLHI